MSLSEAVAHYHVDRSTLERDHLIRYSETTPPRGKIRVHYLKPGKKSKRLLVRADLEAWLPSPQNPTAERPIHQANPKAASQAPATI
jgi:hypothetical protein